MSAALLVALIHIVLFPRTAIAGLLFYMYVTSVQDLGLQQGAFILLLVSELLDALQIVADSVSRC